MGKFNLPKGSQTFVATDKAADPTTLISAINAQLTTVYANFTLMNISFTFDSATGEHICYLNFIV